MTIVNPAFDYDTKKHSYAAIRKADPRIMAYVERALGSSATVVNVGAGTGSYEPPTRYVVAVEPSPSMRKKRIELGRNPAIDSTAAKLPFDDGAFDAALAILTIHHWKDLEKGLLEVRRVTRKKVVILTYDPDLLNIFWNADYFPQVAEVERLRYPRIARISSILGSQPTVTTIRIPLDCSDGIQEAFYGRPEAFLDEDVRRSQSAWGFIDRDLEDRYVEALRRDLADGTWDRKYGHHRKLPEFAGAYRVLEYQVTA